MLSPFLFNLYPEYIIQNARLDESQTGIKIAGRNISNVRYAQQGEISTLMAERGTNEPLDEGESKKGGLKLSIQKTEIMASVPLLYGKQKGKKWKQWQILFSWAPKSLWMVTAAMKLKDACSLEGKL